MGWAGLGWAGQSDRQLQARGEGIDPELNINSMANTASWDQVVPPPWVQHGEGWGGGTQEKTRWNLEYWPHRGRSQLRPSKPILALQPHPGREEPGVGNREGGRAMSKVRRGMQVRQCHAERQRRAGLRGGLIRRAGTIPEKVKDGGARGAEVRKPLPRRRVSKNEGIGRADRSTGCQGCRQQVLSPNLHFLYRPPNVPVSCPQKLCSLALNLMPARPAGSPHRIGTIPSSPSKKASIPIPGHRGGA